MASRTPVKELSPGDDVRTIVVEVLDPSIRKTSAGKDYFQFTGRDDSGSVDFKKWTPTKLPDGGYKEEQELRSGSIVQVKVTEVTEYRGSPQVKGFTYKVVPEDDQRYEKYAAMTKFGPSDKELDGIMGQMREMLSSISHPQLRKMCLAYLDENAARIRQCPAAPHKDGHHGYDGGFAKHVSGVMRLAKTHAEMVGSKFVSMSVVLAGAFLHDVGKFGAYTERGLDRTTAGRLLGHIAIGLPIVDRLCEEHGVDAETATMVKHIVVSHHGRKKYGSPEEPQTIEAEIVAWADMADSRVEGVRMKLQNGLSPGDFVGNPKYGQHTAYVPPEPVEEE